MLKSLRLKRGRETDDVNLVHNDIKASEETSVSSLRMGRQLLVRGEVCSDGKSPL